MPLHSRGNAANRFFYGTDEPPDVFYEFTIAFITYTKDEFYDYMPSHITDEKEKQKWIDSLDEVPAAFYHKSICKDKNNSGIYFKGPYKDAKLIADELTKKWERKKCVINGMECTLHNIKPSQIMLTRDVVDKCVFTKDFSSMVNLTKNIKNKLNEKELEM